MTLMMTAPSVVSHSFTYHFSIG